MLLERAIATVQSSYVCPSVTLVIHAYTVQSIEIHFKLYDRAMFLVS